MKPISVDSKRPNSIGESVPMNPVSVGLNTSNIQRYLIIINNNGNTNKRTIMLQRSQIYTIIGWIHWITHDEIQ